MHLSVLAGQREYAGEIFTVRLVWARVGAMSELATYMNGGIMYYIILEGTLPTAIRLHT